MTVLLAFNAKIIWKATIFKMNNPPHIKYLNSLSWVWFLLRNLQLSINIREIREKRIIIIMAQEMPPLLTSSRWCWPKQELQSHKECLENTLTQICLKLNLIDRGAEMAHWYPLLPLERIKMVVELCILIHHRYFTLLVILKGKKTLVGSTTFHNLQGHYRENLSPKVRDRGNYKTINSNSNNHLL